MMIKLNNWFYNYGIFLFDFLELIVHLIPSLIFDDFIDLVTYHSLFKIIILFDINLIIFNIFIRKKSSSIKIKKVLV